MQTDVLLNNFDLLFTTEERIDRFNSLILDLAMRGKLNTQDPNDESASELLKKIKAEKEKLIKEGKIRKENPLPPIKEDEIPYELPVNWEWVRLSDIANYGGMENVTSKDVREDTWVLDLEDIEKSTSRLLQKVRFKDKNFSSSKKRFCINDVLYGKLRPYLDKVLVADEDGICTTEIIPIRGYYGIDPFYLRLTLKRPDFLKYIERLMYGVKMPRLGTEDAKKILIPLPPYEEQKRIVQKVESLINQANLLKDNFKTKNQSLLDLNKSALYSIGEAKTDEEYQKNWEFITHNFDDLYSNLENIKQLRQTILQEAMKGKLVPQDPNEEPASELLKKIKAEKEKLIKEGKIRKENPLPEIKEDEIPYKLPVAWEWARLNEICLAITDGDHQAPPKVDNGIPFLVISNVNDGNLDITKATRFVPQEYFEKILFIRKPNKGDILYTVVGSFGIPVLIDTNREFCFQRHIALLKPSRILNVYYLLSLMKSVLVYNQARAYATGIAQLTVPLKGLRNIIFPLPPLEEQKRIVEKVENLFKICDELETSIKQGQRLNDALFESVLHGVFNGVKTGELVGV